VWFMRSKFLDYCRLFSALVGPTIRVTEDIPVTVIAGDIP